MLPTRHLLDLRRVRPRSAQAQTVKAQRGVTIDPFGFALFIHKRDADRHVRLRVGQVDHFGLGFVAYLNPFHFHFDRVQVAGFDFIQFASHGLGETAHHFQQEQRTESLVLAAGRPYDFLQRVNPSKFQNINVVASFGPARKC